MSVYAWTRDEERRIDCVGEGDATFPRMQVNLLAGGSSCFSASDIACQLHRSLHRLVQDSILRLIVYYLRTMYGEMYESETVIWPERVFSFYNAYTAS